MSHPDFHLENLRKLRHIFANNGYPKYLLKKFFGATSNSHPRRLTDMTAPRPSATITYRRLPYVPGLSQPLSSLFRLDGVRVAYYNLSTVGELFTKLKHRTSLEKMSGVVYEIPCADCPLLYVGQTKNWLKTRIGQHMRDIKNQKLTSALAQHSVSMGHDIDFDGVKVIYKKRLLRERLFFEMIGIRTRENTMNLRSDVEGLSSIYSFLLNLHYGEDVDTGDSTMIQDLSELMF